MRFSTRNILSALLLMTTVILTVCAVSDRKRAEEQYAILYNRYNRTMIPACPTSASFANENVPLDQHYVKESLDREILATTFMQSSTILMFKRANRWFPIMEPILKKNGIPDDFKFLAVAESNLSNVVSSQKAEGYWQFLEKTGKEYGLEINDYVDERYHIEKSTEAACSYFKAAYSKFGSWTLAAAAFNRGSEGLDRAIRSQRATRYYDLYLNEETSRYVYRIIALKEIYNHPVRYGYFLRENDFYPTFVTNEIKTDSSITNLPLFAINQSTTYRMLRELNPWIRNYSLPNSSGKIYVIKLPANGSYPFAENGTGDGKSEVFFHDTIKINDLH